MKIAIFRRRTRTPSEAANVSARAIYSEVTKINEPMGREGDAEVARGGCVVISCFQLWSGKLEEHDSSGHRQSVSGS